MALRKRGKHFYGDSQADIRPELGRYSRSNTYVVHHFQDEGCACGATALRLRVDDQEGAAVVTCLACKLERPLVDSARYLDVAELEECECPCGNVALEITLGVSLYADSEDVRWLYIGCRCPKCKLVAVYADWKYDGDDFRKLLGLPEGTASEVPAGDPRAELLSAPAVIKGIKLDKPSVRSGKPLRFELHFVSATAQVVTVTASEGFTVSPTSFEEAPAAIEGWSYPTVVVHRRGSTTPSCLLTFRMGSAECRKRVKITE
jgi:hypothetical protein